MKHPKIYLEPKDRVATIISLLEKEHQDAKISLKYKNPLELLIATILSAQCTDKRVNLVTKTLFKKYTTAKDYATADVAELEHDIKSTGFYKTKAKHIKQTCQLLVQKHHSQVPHTMTDLLELPGVARKTANIVLANAYGIIAGVAVDTHVRRLAQRLGLTQTANPARIELDLMKIVPKASWKRITDLLILHGRRICNARSPKCNMCVLNKYCPSAFTLN